MLVQFENSLESWKDKIIIQVINIESSELIYSEFTHYLSPEELEKLNSFKFHKDKLRYSITYHYLRIFLSKILKTFPGDIELVTNRYGKKRLKNPDYSNIQFNISHSDQMLVYAFNQNDQLGIDVEKVDFNLSYLELIEKYFSKNERAFVFEAKDLKEQVIRFYKIWTRKEAYLKAIGTGLSDSLQTLDVLEDELFFPKKKYNSDSFEEVYHLSTLFNTGAYVISLAWVGQLKDAEVSFEKL